MALPLMHNKHVIYSQLMRYSYLNFVGPEKSTGESHSVEISTEELPSESTKDSTSVEKPIEEPPSLEKSQEKE